MPHRQQSNARTWGWVQFRDPFGRLREQWFVWRLKSTYAGTGCFVDEIEHTLRVHRRVDIHIEGVRT